jgi:hypothetical protein
VSLSYALSGHWSSWKPIQRKEGARGGFGGGEETWGSRGVYKPILEVPDPEIGFRHLSIHQSLFFEKGSFGSRSRPHWWRVGLPPVGRVVMIKWGTHPHTLHVDTKTRPDPNRRVVMNFMKTPQGTAKGTYPWCVCLLLQYLAVRVGGGGQRRTCAARDDEPRPVCTSLPNTPKCTRGRGRMCERRRRRRGAREGAREGACTGAAAMPQPSTLRLIRNAAALAAASPTGARGKVCAKSFKIETFRNETKALIFSWLCPDHN